jgi:hypothetical protein
MEYLSLLCQVCLLPILFVQRQQLQLKLIYIGVVDQSAILIMDWKLFGYKLCIF